jgi:hypothetical protein
VFGFRDENAKNSTRRKENRQKPKGERELERERERETRETGERGRGLETK